MSTFLHRFHTFKFIHLRELCKKKPWRLFAVTFTILIQNDEYECEIRANVKVRNQVTATLTDFRNIRRDFHYYIKMKH